MLSSPVTRSARFGQLMLQTKTPLKPLDEHTKIVLDVLRRDHLYVNHTSGLGPVIDQLDKVGLDVVVQSSQPGKFDFQMKRGKKVLGRDSAHTFAVNNFAPIHSAKSVADKLTHFIISVLCQQVKKSG